MNMPRAASRNNPKLHPLEKRARIYQAKYEIDLECKTQFSKDVCRTLAALRVELDRLEAAGGLGPEYNRTLKLFNKTFKLLPKPKAIPQPHPVEPTPAPESDFWGAAVG